MASSRSAFAAVLIAASCTLGWLTASNCLAQTFAQEKKPAEPPPGSVLPLPEPPFKVVIGKTYKESKEDWPKVPTAPQDAPNVVLILLDDVGFADQYLRRADPDAEPRQARQQGAEV